MSFNVETPFQQPLGGSESALCYLAIALADEGCEVFILSNTQEVGYLRGVHCLNYQQTVESGFLRSKTFDCVVVINAARLSNFFRSLLPPQTLLWLWITIDVDQPPIYPLIQADLRSDWHRFILVSDYQRTRFINHYHLPEKLAFVLRNAIAPGFENLFISQDDLLTSKRFQNIPVLAYTSTPFRGLESLLDLYQPFRKLFPDAQLRVYSSMKVYQKDEAAEEKWLKDLYQRCQNTAGITYIGSLAQPQLAAALKQVSILAYPNTFAETACISVMEALASGCLVVTSELGALPETIHRFGQLVPVTFRTVEQFEKEYLNALSAVYLEFFNNPQQMYKHLWEQVLFMNQHYTWHVRAKEWMAAIDSGML